MLNWPTSTGITCSPSINIIEVWKKLVKTSPHAAVNLESYRLVEQQKRQSATRNQDQGYRRSKIKALSESGEKPKSESSQWLMPSGHESRSTAQCTMRYVHLVVFCCLVMQSFLVVHDYDEWMMKIINYLKHNRESYRKSKAVAYRFLHELFLSAWKAQTQSKGPVSDCHLPVALSL